MKRRGWLVVLAALVVAAEAPKDDATKKDLELFQGTWKINALETEGKKVSVEGFMGFKLVIKGDKFTSYEGENPSKGTFKIDATQKPRHVDITFTDAGPLTGKTLQGIYEIDKETYKVCLDMNGKGRPKEFATTEGSGYVLEVLKRAKP